MDACKVAPFSLSLSLIPVCKNPDHQEIDTPIWGIFNKARRRSPWYVDAERELYAAPDAHPLKRVDNKIQKKAKKQKPKESERDMCISESVEDNAGWNILSGEA